MLKVIQRKFLLDLVTQTAAAHRPIQRKSNHLHISSVYDCLRQQGYELLEYEPSNDPWERFWDESADIGNLIHTSIQRDLILAGSAVLIPGHTLPPEISSALPKTFQKSWEETQAPGIEVPLTLVCDPMLRGDLQQRHLSGRIDAVFRLSDGRLALLDIKTTKPDAFTQWYKFLPDKLAKWESQQSLYMHYFEMPDGERARDGFIWMINRGDTSQSRVYEVQYDAARVRVDLDRAQDAADAIARGVLPVPEPARGVCKLCRYRTHCESSRAESGW